MANVPTTLTIFAYQVGFGDCFLLRFGYPSGMRHILIDFGTTGLPEDTAADQLTRIARHVAATCGGRLDAVVATHRHADHISGFATNPGGTAPGDIIRKLQPKVVVQPWTEELDLAVDARAPSPQAGFRAALQSMHQVAEKAVGFVNGGPPGLTEALKSQLRFIGEDNLSNKSAVLNLSTMGGEQRYVYHGAKSGLEKTLPGVTIHVLGPPTLEQTGSISRQRSRDPDEFWQFQLRRVKADADASTAAKARPAFPSQVAARGGKLPLGVRWLASRLRQARGEQFLAIVRALDKQMNNTSVILLFETANKKILFPGDGQIENWQYALSQPKTRKLLESVDVYKVGHHGSLNATPRSMWNAFSKKGPKSRKGRMTTVLSTRPDKHGSVEAGTEVPRTTLLNELGAHTDLHSTHLMAHDKLFDQIEIPL
ncbi:hypothetical protein [Duganella callida]|uniref:MBL fold metallo-hydrolase n=1 Tax=Duganella callida TaxID=2561932 RepID=A0A4Y9SC78_9BURK|nr:hypothetical protein [Duganella callida]TFW20088.1 hypothetical protein E4L98_15270 [Duganella callida]